MKYVRKDLFSKDTFLKVDYTYWQFKKKTIKKCNFSMKCFSRLCLKDLRLPCLLYTEVKDIPNI